MQAKEVFSSSFCVLSVKIIKVFRFRYCSPSCSLLLPSVRSVATTAADSAIQCRCGMAFIAASFLQAFCAALSFRPVSTTAVYSAVRCRCGMAFQSAPCHRLSKRHCASESFSSFHIIHLPSYTLSSFHLPKVCSIPTFSSHLPKVRGGGTASRAPCINVSPVTVPFPPSEVCIFLRFPHTFRRWEDSAPPRETPVAAFFRPPHLFHLPKVPTKAHFPVTFSVSL